MKIVVLDGYAENPGDLSWEAIAKYGELTVYDRTPYEEAEIIRRIGDADVIFTNKCPISQTTMDACTKLKFISVLATGYNVVDVKYAAEKGIKVSNVPSYGTQAVAQAAIALLLEICNHVQHHSDAVHEGRWASSPDWCFWDHPIIELSGKTLGIIGFGRIGQTTGMIARALGMDVLAAGSRETAAGREIASYVDLDTLLSRSDVIALHCPLTSTTEKMINKASIAKMKDGVIIINNSRGQLIDELDLAEALDSGKVFAAGLDVVSSEPIRDDNPLLKAKNCIITPHISWAAKEARERIMQTSEENLKAFLAGKAQNLVS